MNQIQRPSLKKDAPVVKSTGVDLTDEEIAAQLDAEEKAEKQAVEAQKSLDANKADSEAKKIADTKPMTKVEKKAKRLKLSPIDVVATEIGYYANRRIKVGDKFKLEDESDFSHNWMKKII